MRIRELSSLALITASLAIGCSSRPAPAFASSANESSYAERYPAALLALRTEFAADEARARDIFGGFSNYPGALTAPDGQQVLGVVTRADAAGKSGAYAEQARENQDVTHFFSDEKDSLNQKVGGAAQYAAKQKDCTVDVASPAVGALDHGVDKALEERLRGHDEAHRYIDDHQDALGKPNLEKLQKQADDISLASYLVHVRVKELKLELSRLVDEASDVKKTLTRSDTDAKAVIADAGASKSAKATAQTRATAAEAAEASLDSEVDQAKRAVADMDTRSTQLEKDYGAALDALEKALGNLPKKA
jgi:hypothetical protein